MKGMTLKGRLGRRMAAAASLAVLVAGLVISVSTVAQGPNLRARKYDGLSPTGAQAYEGGRNRGVPG